MVLNLGKINMKRMLLVGLVWAALGCAALLGEQSNSLPADPDQAWQEIETASKAPPIPKEWGPKGPTPEQQKDFEKMLSERSAHVAEKAHEFYTRVPDHAKAADAKAREEAFNQQAMRFVNTAGTEK